MGGFTWAGMSVFLSQLMQPDYGNQYNVTPNADPTHLAMVKNIFCYFSGSLFTDILSVQFFKNRTDSSLPVKPGQRRAVPLSWDLVFTFGPGQPV